MAFVSGYTTKYECKICNAYCEEHWTGIPLYIRYQHPESSMYKVNGYPKACENNGKLLEDYEIEQVSIPIIHKDKITMSF